MLYRICVRVCIWASWENYFTTWSKIGTRKFGAEK